MARNTGKGVPGFAAALLVISTWATVVSAQTTQDLIDRLDRAPRIPSLNPRDVRYGRHFWQHISLYARPGAHGLPLVIWVNSRDRLGAPERLSLEWLPPLLYDQGFALADVRVRPDAEGSAAERAQDVATAIATLVGGAGGNRVDAGRIVLIGSGLNAHFVALLGTDPSWLEHAGVRFEAVRAVIAVQGVGFDVPRRVAADDYESRYFRRFFGPDPVQQASLSPVSHVALPNAPSFLFYVAEGDGSTAAQADEMASILARHAAEAEVRSVPATHRGVAGTYLGAPQHPETARLLAYLRDVLNGSPGLDQGAPLTRP